MNKLRFLAHSMLVTSFAVGLLFNSVNAKDVLVEAEPTFASRSPGPARLVLAPTSGVPQDFTVAKPPEGRVHFLRGLDKNFTDSYFLDLTSATQDFMLDKYLRVVAHGPYFDEYTNWYKDRAWEYENLYAVYNCEQFDCDEHWVERTAEIFEEHPEWVLYGEDEAGQPIPLYIRFGCGEEPCTQQFAADIGNPEFRQSWIDEVTTNLNAADAVGYGYRGIFVDDVRFDLDRAVWRFAEGPDGEAIWSPGDPIDPRTGDVMTPEAWLGYMVDFLEEIRAAFPFHQIVHNPVWFRSNPDDPDDEAWHEAWERAIDAADIVNFERGLIDYGLTAGWGPLGVASFLAMNDLVHERNRRLNHYVHIPTELSANEEIEWAEYGLAGWLLVSGGRDFFGSDRRSTPDDWWSGFDVELGNALGERVYDEKTGLYRRRFERGLVLLREPVASGDTLEVDLGEFGGPYVDLQGNVLSEVELPARTGVILRRVLGADSYKANP